MVIINYNTWNRYLLCPQNNCWNCLPYGVWLYAYTVSDGIADSLDACVFSGRLKGFWYACMEPGQDLGNGLLGPDEWNFTCRQSAGSLYCHLDILPCVHCNWITNMLILHLWDMRKV